MPSAVLLAWVVDRQSVAVKIRFVIRLSMLDTRQPVHPDRYFRRHSITVGVGRLCRVSAPLGLARRQSLAMTSCDFFHSETSRQQRVFGALHSLSHVSLITPQSTAALNSSCHVSLLGARSGTRFV